MNKRYWGGFSDGELHWTIELHSGAQIPAIYRTRKDARKFYEDVRPVWVSTVMQGE